MNSKKDQEPEAPCLGRNYVLKASTGTMGDSIFFREDMILAKDISCEGCPKCKDLVGAVVNLFERFEHGDGSAFIRWDPITPKLVGGYYSLQLRDGVLYWTRLHYLRLTGLTPRKAAKLSLGEDGTVKSEVFETGRNVVVPLLGVTPKEDEQPRGPFSGGVLDPSLGLPCIPRLDPWDRVRLGLEDDTDGELPPKGGS